jgi:cellulose synthase/poly-beta-1,6-N-acetylglucosamine synthase-like glycosyltransferase
MTSMEITVVIPTFNRAATLKRAVRSVQRQTYQNLAIFIYDNASTDETAETVRQLMESDSRIHYQRRKYNVGAARNFLGGIQNVTTPLFLLLSDDDVILPDFFADAITWLGRYPAARFAAGGTIEMSERGQFLFAPQAYWQREGYFEPPEGLNLMLRGFHPSWNTVVYRRQALDEAGAFDEALQSTADLDFTLRIACRYPYVVFRKPSGIFVRRTDSITDLTNRSVDQQYDLIIERLASCPDISGDTKELIARTLSGQSGKRLIQIAFRQLLRLDANAAGEALGSYRRRYPRTALYAAVTTIARVGKALPPLLYLLQPIEALRRIVRAWMSLAAARMHGAAPIDSKYYATFLKLPD